MGSLSDTDRRRLRKAFEAIGGTDGNLTEPADQWAACSSAR